MAYDYRNLLGIQELDQKLMNLLRDLEAIPNEIQQLESTNEKEKKGVEQVKSDIKSLTLKRRDLEKQVEAKTEHEKKLKNQRGLVKTNEEYKALEKEINTDRVVIAL